MIIVIAVSAADSYLVTGKIENSDAKVRGCVILRSVSVAGALTTLYLASNVLQHFRLFIGTTDLNSNVRIRSAVAGLNLRFDFHVSGKAGNLILQTCLIWL